MIKKKDDIEFIALESDEKVSEYYKIGNRIGKGSFGIVYEATNLIKNSKCCLKRVNRKKNQNKDNAYDWSSEVRILYTIKHQSIVELYGVVKTPSFVYFVMELCLGGSLTQHIGALTNSDLGFEEAAVREIIRQLTAALVYMHNRSIVHRDVKPDNVLFVNKVVLRRNTRQPSPSNSISFPPSPLADTSSTKLVRQTLNKVNSSSDPSSENFQSPNGLHFPVKRRPKSTLSINGRQELKSIFEPDSQKGTLSEFKVKLIDLGMAIELRRTEEAVAGICGTPYFMAPEVLAGRLYTRQCDVWSLGIITFQLLTKRLPFTSTGSAKLLDEVTKCTLKDIQGRIGNHVSPLARDWLLCVLNRDPIHRLSAAELLRHKWLIPPFVSTSATQDPPKKLSSTLQNTNPDDSLVLPISESIANTAVPSHTSIFNFMKIYKP